MIVVKMPLRLGMHVKHVWLASSPPAGHAMSFSVHYDCLATGKFTGFVRVPKQALFVDLRIGAEKILEPMNFDSRYSVRRSTRDGVVMEIETDAAAFAEMYDAFAKTKNFSPVNRRKLELYWPQMLVTKCLFNGTPLGMHSYFMDLESRRLTLVWAASLFRTASTSAERGVYARANLYHFWKDMQLAEQRGGQTYDFGYFGDTTQGMDSVNKFKLRFPCST